MRSLLLLLTVLAVPVVDSFADSVFVVTDARSVEGHVSAYAGGHPSQVNWNETFTPSGPTFSVNGQPPPVTPPADYGSFSVSQTSTISETALKGRMSFAVQTSGWVAGYRLRSTFDLTFNVESWYDFDLKSNLQFVGTSNVTTQVRPKMTLYMTGPAGDVFRYTGNPFYPGVPFPPLDPFNVAGVLAPGQYRLFAEALLDGGVYRAERDNRRGFVDFNMALTPTASVPEGPIPVWFYSLALLTPLLIRYRSALGRSGRPRLEN